MDFWTVMLITLLGGDLDGTQLALPFTSIEHCEASTDDIAAALGYDLSMICVESDTPSGSIRPKARP
jgi:hypothetical protein